MAQFAYKARGQDGSLVQGMMDGEDMNVVRQKLSEQGLIPIQVTGKSGLNINIELNVKKSVSHEELVLFTKQFHTLFKAGMGMEAILTTLAKQTKNKFLQDTLEGIRKDIEEGANLAKAFGKHPKVFDQLYINMLSSGEEAGILEEVLEHLSVLLEKDFLMKKAIKSATLYPKIVIGVLVAACTAMMLFIVPRFMTLFSTFDAELPLPTRILIGTSNFMRSYFILIVIFVAFLVFLYKRFVATPKGRFSVDKAFFKVPIFGSLALKVCNARFANILSSLYRAGLPVTKALEITAAVIGNEAYMRDVKVLQSNVEKGGSIADGMRRLNYFSPIIIESTSIGERTGSLDSMLKSVAGHYDMEVEHTVKNLTTLIEPIMLVLIFGMVLVFALAIFLPMWTLSDAVL